ncbi:hypothetical protein [Paraglaciecola aestuariivivens]
MHNKKLFCLVFVLFSCIEFSQFAYSQDQLVAPNDVPADFAICVEQTSYTNQPDKLDELALSSCLAE